MDQPEEHADRGHGERGADVPLERSVQEPAEEHLLDDGGDEHGRDGELRDDRNRLGLLEQPHRLLNVVEGAAVEPVEHPLPAITDRDEHRQERAEHGQPRDHRPGQAPELQPERGARVLPSGADNPQHQARHCQLDHAVRGEQEVYAAQADDEAAEARQHKVEEEDGEHVQVRPPRRLRPWKGKDAAARERHAPEPPVR